MYSYLLEKYVDTKDVEIRNQIIECHLPLVTAVVAKVYNKQMLPDYEFTDLVQFGVFGLINAIENYDKKKADRFSTYAWIKIRGAIIDEMRKLDFVPRATRAKVKTMYKLLQENEEANTPNNIHKVAKQVGLKMRDIDVFYGDYKISLEECVGL